ncbi:MAG: choice-of-anchor D domain-containing protein, partial [Myxococcota bacterium]
MPRVAGGFFIAACAAALLAAGCDDAAFSDVEACLQVVGYGDCQKLTQGVIDFGAVPVGSSRRVELQLKNTGKADALIKETVIGWTGGATKDSFTPVKKPDTVKPATPLSYVIQYNPAAVGADQGSMRLAYYTNKITGKFVTFEFSLVGEGVESSLDVCVMDGDEVGACQSSCPVGKPDCLVLDLGEIKFKGDGASLDGRIAVRNKGKIGLLVNSTILYECPEGVEPATCTPETMEAARNFSVTDPRGGLNGYDLEGESERVLTVRYRPFGGGFHKGVMQVVSSDGLYKKVNVHLMGTSRAPKLCVLPDSLHFSDVPVGVESAQQALKVKSCGTDPLDIGAATLLNSPHGWFTADLSAFPAKAMAAGSSSDVAISCKPSVQGGESAKVILDTNDPGIPGGRAEVSVSCTGKQAPSCLLKAVPVKLDFQTKVTGKKFTDYFSLVNVGELRCDVKSVKPPLQDYTIKSVTDESGRAISAPFAIDPSKNVKVTVEFTAPANGKCSDGKVTVASNSAVTPSLEVPLHGCGGPSLCRLNITPQYTLNFGAVSEGKSKTMGIKISNTGSDDCAINSVTPGQCNGGWFALGAKPLMVGAGKTETLSVTCTPKSTGSAPGDV